MEMLKCARQRCQLALKTCAIAALRPQARGLLLQAVRRLPGPLPFLRGSERTSILEHRAMQRQGRKLLTNNGALSAGTAHYGLPRPTTWFDQNVPRLGKLLHCGRVSGCNADRVAVRRHHARRRLVYASGFNATSAFLTPTLILFGGVLFECMAVLPPWPSAWPVGIILGLCGLIGLAFKFTSSSGNARSILPRLIGSTGPCFRPFQRSYASLIAGAAGLIAEKFFAPFAIAGAITLLLLAGIYGAWSVTLWIARNRDKI